MKIRLLFSFCFLFIFMYFLLKFSIIFINTDFFSISEVKIEGNVFITKDIESNLLKLKGKNIWTIDFDMIEDILKEDIRIKTIDITRDIPDKLLIKLEEREEYSYINYKNKIYVADEEGIIYAYRNEAMLKDLIILKIDKYEEIKDLYKVLNNVLDTGLKEFCSEIYKSDNYIKILLKDGLVIKTNLNVDKKKYEISSMLYNKVKNDKVEYIDIRFDDYIVK